ncbi:Cytochrome c oxidase subunit CcoN [Candidatus Phaeomarinobacter ectocarpi]|uniref:cytochrome-c oxidase n=1 Tax=Candidatus Phaeomarinibacter ectocarpi TaxID=1458461 RepID=X5MM78_9HYPH|nr:Cytochrome c oxidase subunit CcoN [Candidatus Phaeomarinobacter ectocarpi]
MTQTHTPEPPIANDGRMTAVGWGAIALFIAGAFLGIFVIAGASSGPMMLHGGLITLFCLLAVMWIGDRHFDFLQRGPTARAPDGVQYNDAVIRWGVIASTFWGVVGFVVGLVIAVQLAYPDLLTGIAELNFGRLRPVHTSAVIFAFGGNILIATSFYVVQRTCKARLAGDIAPWFVFWGYQLFILLAATGYVFGVTQSKEYAEPEWYIDLWLTVVWVVYLLVFLGTLWRRREPHIYVANWFYLAFIVTIAMLHIVNNLAVPVSFTGDKSYILMSGVQDAMTQWWYGHNAVGFFLTAGFLGLMYYFIPKRAERPVYSYRLSIIHFWALIFLYIWAGPHHLHFTALPDWAQTLGATFSIMLWMPSWGGMINGLMTLAGAWDRLRTDPVIRMLVVSVAFYGMSTFEGPLMSIKAVNGLSHYTDWTIGHVHSGALGWVGFVSFGALYCLTPWVWRRQRLYSLALVEWHFWVATLGIVLYITSMWVSGILQGLMWRAYDELGFLEYSFVETVEAMHPFYVIRALGGALFVVGSLIMAYNLYKTAKGEIRASEPLDATAGRAPQGELVAAPAQ